MVRNLILRENHYSGIRPNPYIADDTQRDRTSTDESAMAKSILDGVRGSANAYPPLKSVAKYLYLLLDNCQVRPPSLTPDPQRLQPR